MRRLIRIAILIVGALTAQAVAATTVSDHDRFRLWNNCKGLHLQITVKPNLVEEIGISKERIESHLRDKLRAERIYVTKILPSQNMMLFISLQGHVITKTVENYERKHVAYGVMGGFSKQFPSLENLTITFVDFNPTYTINPTPQSIESEAVSYGRALIDDFYLRANADACKNSN